MYTLGEKIIPREIEEEIKDSYISYAMSVIVGRALPDVRDGLKPVHRRILYGMQDLGLDPGKPYKKAARIVGEILGKYHPHGDIAVFDALVRMVQDFSLRYPLIDGQGNFGCFTGDTKIKLLDGTNKSFEELSQLPPTTTFYVYSVNKDNQIVVGQSRHARATRRNAALVEVVLDNEAKIRCTPDHRFLLRNGTYKEARDLTPDDSLMAGYHDLAPVREELFAVAGKQNHRAASVRLVQERADVYDITVDEHHNFLLDAGVFVHNSVDGDAPAAMRYVEARLAPVATELLSDIDKDTVDFVPNFDGSLTEPKVLPSRLPNLLVNGSSGIAVGMATNIPPHNLSEVVDAACALIDNPEIELSGLTRHIRGPDFPTGAIICGRDGIKDAYQAGRGSLRIRAKAQSEQLKGNRQALVITELPYQVNKATLLETIAKLVQEKTIEGISDLRDESDKDGMRVVIELKRDANDQVVLNQLYKHTQLETTFGIIMLALVDGRPRVLGLKALLQTFVDHRKEIIVRRTRFELARAQERAHILEGLKKALAHLDAVIKTIRQSKSPQEAKEALVKRFDFTEKQAQAILEMQLQRLTALERDKIEAEYLELIKKIEYYQMLLKSEQKVLGLIKEELQDVKKRFGDPRRTEVLGEVKDFAIEDLIAEEDVVITISHGGYIKRLPVSAYRKQRRGGVGVTAMETKEEDFVEHLFVASTHQTLLFFTNQGRCYWLKVHEVPQASRYARGTAIVNLLSLQKDERLSTFVAVREFAPEQFLVMATKQGTVKKTKLDAYANPRKAGIIAITLEKGDELIEARVTDGERELLLATRQGKSIRFPETQAREVGRASRGVRGIRLGKGDEVIAMAVVQPKASLLTVTALGFGKRTELDEYRVQSRGGKGIINLKVTKKNGDVVGAKMVTDQDEAMLISQEGMMVRCAAKDIRSTGRAAQGVRLINIKGKDRLASVARVVPKEREETDEPPAPKETEPEVPRSVSAQAEAPDAPEPVAKSAPTVKPKPAAASRAKPTPAPPRAAKKLSKRKK